MEYLKNKQQLIKQKFDKDEPVKWLGYKFAEEMKRAFDIFYN